MDDADRADLPAPAGRASGPGSASSPSRRSVLAAGLLLPLAACTGPAPPGPPPPVDPDVALRAAAVAREQSLIALYDAALSARTGAGRATLETVRSEHLQHLAALTAAPPGGTSGGSTAPATTPPAATPPAATPPGPRSPAPGQAELRAAEAAAQLAHAEAVLPASRALAALLASLAAAEAAHAVVLA
ncbi:MAG TPA: hypothetical protein VFR07_00030 [Mycobacteriales bacterium]|nr:hypothetical protein [Mycobacteriales bacterium]